jgi:hypothetical protein
MTDRFKHQQESDSVVFRMRLIGLVVVFLLSVCVNGMAQQQDDPVDPGASDDVEMGEDQYRRSMELEEADDPVDLSPQGGFDVKRDLKKIDKLPPKSRQHLRAELRGIIIEEGQWTPEDADKEYPYEPSDAAKTDSDLRQAEEEAWDELVDDYQQREAEAYAASNGTQSGAQGGAGNESSTAGESGSAGSENGGDGQQNGGPSGAYNPGSAGEDEGDEPYTEGVSQSALDFLKGVPAAGGGENRQDAGQQGGQIPPTQQAGDKPGSNADTSETGSEPTASANPDPATEQGDEDVNQQTSEETGSAPAEASNSGQEAGEDLPDGSLEIEELDGLNNSQSNPPQDEAGSPGESDPAETNDAEPAESESSPPSGQAEPTADSPSDPTEQATPETQQGTDGSGDGESPPKPEPAPGTIAIDELFKLDGYNQQEPPGDAAVDDEEPSAN